MFTLYKIIYIENGDRHTRYGFSRYILNICCWAIRNDIEIIWCGRIVKDFDTLWKCLTHYWKCERVN